MNGHGAGSVAAMPIAIIGIGCRFPGGIVDTDSFWRVLADGVDAIGEIPADRFDIAKYYDPKPGVRGRIMTKWGGFVEQRLEDYDAAFFGISRSYADRLDPQQRLLLETSWEALEDAGLDAVGLQGSATGIFVGQWTSDFEHRLFSDASGIDFQMAMGSGRYAAAGRLSYALGFRGPSLSIDAACSSGLASVHLAVRSLRSGDSAVALAGGVNMIMEPHIHLAYSYSKMMAPDGRCRFGDAAGKGYVRAEGAGMVVLKPLDAALADGDHVYAVIRGSAVNNDGNSSGAMGRPSRIGQEELLRSALNEGGVHASQLDYVEAHGTGTKAGDPVELGALATVLAEGRPADAAPTWVGSVKTNFGHTEAAAGVAGLIKAALMLERGMIPPSLHFDTPNTEVPWASIPIAIPTSLMPWPARSGPRFAGVSSYGIGGTNAHAVLESAPVVVPAERVAPPSGTPLVLPLSGRGDAGSRAVAAVYASHLEQLDPAAVPDFCWTAATRRSALTHRAAFVATDREALIAALREYATGGPATASGVVHDRARRRVAFVVPGQGAQWVGMARQLASTVPIFRAALERCDAAARRIVPWSIIDQLYIDEGTAAFQGDRIDVIQPTLIAIAIAYAAWLRSIGIEPDAVVGHSLGEVGAAAIAGVLDIDSAMRVICQRSLLMQRTSGQGAMAVVELSRAEAEARLVGYETRVSIAVSNSPKSTVISGDPSAVSEILAALERDGVFCRLVKVDVASHSPQMDPLVPELVQALDGLPTMSGTVPVYSTVSASIADGDAFGASYWGQNLRQPVQFGATVERLIADGFTAFIELGPHPVLTQAIEQTAKGVGKDVVAVACGRRDTADLLAVHSAVASLWTRGVAVDWMRTLPRGGRLVKLPFYPWQRERHWVDAADLIDDAGTAARKSSLDEHAKRALHTLVWQESAMPSSTTQGLSTWIVVGAPGDAAESVAAALRDGGASATVVASMADAGVALRAEEDRRDAGIIVLPASDADIAYSPVAGMQALQQSMGDTPGGAVPRVWWVTVGAHAVAGTAPAAACAARAAAWGAARVLGEEYPQWWGGLMDLDPSQSLAAQSPAIVAHLATGTAEDQVAFRDGTRYALRLVRAAAQHAPPVAWRADAAYLITGGFGGVALQMAHAMVSDGARRLVLLGRTTLPPRAAWASLDPASAIGQRVAAVRALEHAGASVHLLSADISDEASVRAALATYEAEGWPPIDGVIHNAAVLGNRLARDLTPSDFDAVLAPKLGGATVLDRIFPTVSVFVLSSSISAYWAPPGMANYAAANAGVDALAAARRARGVHAVSIQWCPWHDVGMHHSANMSRNFDEMAKMGVRSITGEEGVAFFRALITRPESVLSVLPIDWGTYRKARRGRDASVFRAIPDALPQASDAEATDGVLQQLKAASVIDRRTLLDTLVRNVVAGVIRRPAAQLDAQQPFGAVGVDSLMALEIRNRLETALERRLTATLTWNYPTVEALAAHLDTLIAPVSPAGVAAVPEAAAEQVEETVPAFAEIVALSDADALRALRRGK